MCESLLSYCGSLSEIHRGRCNREVASSAFLGRARAPSRGPLVHWFLSSAARTVVRNLPETKFLPPSATRSLYWTRNP